MHLLCEQRSVDDECNLYWSFEQYLQALFDPVKATAYSFNFQFSRTRFAANGLAVHYLALRSKRAAALTRANRTSVRVNNNS